MPMYDDDGRLLVSSGFGDRITDLDGDTYVIAAEEYIDFFANGARYARIDVNGVQVTEYLAHYGDLDTYIRFRTNRIGIVVGNVDILDIIPAGVVWNEPGADVDHRWEGVGAPNAFFIQGSDGKAAFGCADIPHGGVGAAMLALEGADSNVDGPHIQFTTASDDYPLMQIRPWAHGTIAFLLDAYHDGAYKSSDASSNFGIWKSGDLFRITYDSGIAQGDVVTWNWNGIVLDTSGKVFINDTANAFAFGPSLTIDGAGQDGEYISLQDSTDVAHGMTAITETDTFFTIKKASPATGGTSLIGLSEDTLACQLSGYYTNSNTTKTVGGARAPVEFYVAKKSAATFGDCGADDNVFSIRARVGGSWRAVFMVDEDGDLFADGGIASTNMVTLFDDYEDAHLVRALDLLRGGKGIIKGYWDKFVKYNENNLVELGILGDTIGNGGLLNVTGLQRLHNGAIWQNYTAIKDHDKKLAAYERAFERISQALGIPQNELLALTN